MKEEKRREGDSHGDRVNFIYDSYECRSAGAAPRAQTAGPPEEVFQPCSQRLKVHLEFDFSLDPQTPLVLVNSYVLFANPATESYKFANPKCNRAAGRGRALHFSISRMHTANFNKVLRTSQGLLSPLHLHNCTRSYAKRRRTGPTDTHALRSFSASRPIHR